MTPPPFFTWFDAEFADVLATGIGVRLTDRAVLEPVRLTDRAIVPGVTLTDRAVLGPTLELLVDDA